MGTLQTYLELLRAARDAVASGEAQVADFTIYGCKVMVIPPTAIPKPSYYFWLGDQA